MTEQRKIDLHRMIKELGSVTINIVPFDGSEPTEETFTNYDEALAEIQGYSYENEVYF
tara:strand:+ start:987 stop:1160 length:174 start_codon:yes stop_codon:yes gene_type:complete